MKPILEIQNISKKFRIHHEQKPYLSLRDGFTDFFKHKKNNDEDFWALKDVSFDVMPGDTIGIIGKNGAGKSTLLKILSKITPPTSGKIITRGRIASLLEVGTGFHPELSGRENIFLNGSILGMKKAEIQRNFDAIVDFSGIEKFLDTPLKHYSSGMQLRLAFAVAAFLENEILIIDEVLAVGDAEFQKKCMGKMNEVSKSGRTILFVSHNMPSIKGLCVNGIHLEKGTLKFNGKVEEAIAKYFEPTNILEKKGVIPETHTRTYNTGQAKIKTIQIIGDNNEITSEVFYNEQIKFFLEIDVYTKIEDAVIDIKIVSKEGIIITHSVNLDDGINPYSLEVGINKFEVSLDNFLQPGFYDITVGIHFFTGATIDYLEHIYDFEVLKIGKTKDYVHKWIHGYLNLKSQWKKL